MFEDVDFEEVERYVWTIQGMEEYVRGTYVEYEDYERLLNAYNKLNKDKED